MIRWFEKRLYGDSFRTTFLVWSVILQCIVVIAFAALLVWQVSLLGARTLRENLNVSAASYARNSEFAFITNSDQERRRIIETATKSPTNVAAFIYDTRGLEIASSMDPDFSLTAELQEMIVFEKAPYYDSNYTHQIFVHPVYVSEEDSPALGVDETTIENSLLGYYVLIGSKKIIHDLQRDIVIVSAFGLVLLLLVLLFVNSSLARFILKPVERLVKETELVSAADGKRRIQSEGPAEVRGWVHAMNALLDRYEEINMGLEKLVAEKTREEREARQTAELLRDNRTRIMAANTHDLLTPLRLIINQWSASRKVIR